MVSMLTSSAVDHGFKPRSVILSEWVRLDIKCLITTSYNISITLMHLSMCKLLICCCFVQWVSEWVSDCCLMPTQQFSAISWHKLKLEGKCFYCCSTFHSHSTGSILRITHTYIYVSEVYNDISYVKFFFLFSNYH
jgi:hypothetical protein